MPYTIYNTTATFRLTSVHFCVYLDVSDECSIIHECANFSKSGATLKTLHMKWVSTEASFIRGPTNIKCYYTKYARIHKIQSNVAWIISKYAQFATPSTIFKTINFFTQKSYYYIFYVSTLYYKKELNPILHHRHESFYSITSTVQHANNDTQSIRCLSGSVFQPLYVEPFLDWNMSWNPAGFWIGN
jgi:hypothetical protein